MKLIRGIHNLSQAPQEGCVLTIGNFDGVHRGHRALLQGLQEEGRKRNLPVMVMLFEPQPLERAFRQAFRGVNRAKFHQRSSGEAFARKISCCRG